MPDTTMSYAGHVTEDDVMEYMRLTHLSYDGFQVFQFLVYATPASMALFLPAQLFFPEISPNSFLLGVLAGLAGVYGVWHIANRPRQKEWRKALSQSGSIGPRKLILEDNMLIIENFVETASLRLSAIRNVSTHSRLIMFWIAGSYAHCVPRNIFGSADEEQAFLSELNARMTSSQKE
jgi:hypothetical protein